MDGQDFLSTTRPGPGYADLKKLPMVISESCPYVGAIHWPKMVHAKQLIAFHVVPKQIRYIWLGD